MKRYEKIVKLFVLPTAFAALTLTPNFVNAAQKATTAQDKASETRVKNEANMHEKLAKAHEEAASCLKDKSKSERECQQSFMKQCRESGSSGCSMMRAGVVGKESSEHEMGEETQSSSSSSPSYGSESSS